MTEAVVEILLVEDNPNDVEMTLRAFKKHKLDQHIKVVRDGSEALAFIFGTGASEQHSILASLKLVLLDLKLPKVDGLEVLQRVKSDPRTRTIPVVMLTSSGEAKDIGACYDRGVNSYLVKPVDFTRFTEAARILGLYWVGFNQTPAL